MAYTPYYSGGWQSGQEGGTPITPAALNNMENGITNASQMNDKKSYQFTFDGSTWASVYALVKDMPVYTVATFFATSTGASHISGSKITATLKGIVANNGDGVYDFFAFAGLGPYAYGWRVTTLTGSTAGTVGTVYRFTGTSV